MRILKNLIIFTLVLGVVTLNSCKKDKKEGPISLTADIDGTATNFSVSPVALTGAVDGQTFTVIQGSTSAGATISLTLAGKITAGKTYSDAAASDDDKPLFLYATSSTDDDYLNNDDDAANLPSVTVTSITSTTIDGTFKGSVVKGIEIGNGTLPTKLISSGKFHLNLQSHP
jgi:hypothetical protein